MMKNMIALVFVCGVVVALPRVEAATPPRERISINNGWRFSKQDAKEAGNALSYFDNPGVKEAVIASASATGLSVAQMELGKDVPQTRPDFDDQAWRVLDLPHDWAIEGPFDQNLRGETGKLPHMGIGWYRKTFSVPASDAGRRIYLDVDGAMSYAMVWCNGRFIGGWPYGYSSFRLDLTDAIKPGAENTLAIRLDNPDLSSRWYPGAGIYRNVWLVKTEPVHVAHWGTRVTTPEVTPEKATVAIRVTVKNSSAKEAKATVTTQVYAPGSKEPLLTIPGGEMVLPPASEQSTAATGTLASPRLWSAESPQRYLAVTTVTLDGKPVDVYETPFGVRTIRFTVDDGFHLNGKRVQIKGVCNHHDLGALGAAFNIRAAERQLEIMKEMGFNALRTAHNPPAPELLDLCDRMGILVMDESFDAWKRAKKPNDYSKLWPDWREKDLRALIRRDANHPCVILWSIGNEINELRHDSGPAVAAELAAIVRDEDPTRPTTVASADGHDNGVNQHVDVMGRNYQGIHGRYAKHRANNPDQPMIGSETASTVSSRGEYFFTTREMYELQVAEEKEKAEKEGKTAPAPPPFRVVSENKRHGLSDFQVSSYDLYAPAWAYAPDYEFRNLEQYPFVAGEFVWTGFDYLGEPTPYNNDVSNLLNFHDEAERARMARELEEIGKIRVPSRSSYFGIVDLAGFKKDRFYLYQSHWRPELPMAHILPHWNWPERVGQITPVHLYTSGDEAELFLNGESLGRKKKGDYEYRLRWDDVVYEPGMLEAVTYKDGREWARAVMKTTGPAAKLALEADRSTIKSDGLDLSFVTVRIADQDGLTVPRSKNLVTFEISGPGEIVATDNGDATSHESFQAKERKAYNGLALVIVRAKPGKAGKVVLTAKSEGLDGASVVLTMK